MLKSKTAQWSALTALLCIVVLTLTWFFGVSPRRAQAESLRGDADSVRSQNDLLQTKVAQLKADAIHLPEHRAQLAAIYSQLPPTSNMAQLVSAIDGAARSSGVTLVSIAPGAAELVTDSGGATAPAADPAAAGGTQSSGTGAETASGAASSATAAPNAGTRLVRVPITMTIKGQYFQDVLFVKKLQTDMPRLMLISDLELAAQSEEKSKGQVQLIITGAVFSLPDAAAETATATAGSAGTQAGATSTPTQGTANALPETVSRAGVPASRTAEDS